MRTSSRPQSCFIRISIFPSYGIQLSTSAHRDARFSGMCTYKSLSRASTIPLHARYSPLGRFPLQHPIDAPRCSNVTNHAPLTHSNPSSYWINPPGSGLFIGTLPGQCVERLLNEADVFGSPALT